jgi:hypothetical protein
MVSYPSLACYSLQQLHTQTECTWMHRLCPRGLSNSHELHDIVLITWCTDSRETADHAVLVLHLYISPSFWPVAA